jgi:hypothetical protein
VLNGYIYVIIEADGDGAPKITRFLSRSEALAQNPKLAQIQLQAQLPIVLPAVRNGGQL